MASSRILIYSTAYFPLVGGAEVAVKEITDRLGEYEFDLVTARIKRDLLKKEKIGRVTVHRIGFGIPVLDKMILAVFGHRFGIKLHREHTYSAVWSIMASFGGFAALSFKEKTRIPFLLTLQEGDPIDEILHKVRFAPNRFKKIFTSADALQSISIYLQKWGKEVGFQGKIDEVVPNGVDVTRFTQEHKDEEIQEIRNGFGFEKDAVILVTASRLVVKNGVEDVIRALPLLSDKVCFVICGVGYLEEHLKNVVKELQLEKRVKFLGNKSHEELPKILKASDIFIRPSLSEGLGNSFLEAMAAGLPTVGTPVGGIPDFLEDSVTGFICEKQNPESIKNTIIKILKLSEDEKRIIHLNALKLIEKKYNWEYICERMEHVFKEISS